MPTAGGDAPHAIGIVSSLVAGVGIWDFDLRRGTLECDAGWYRIMGRDPEQPVRSLAGFRPLIHPEDVDRATEVEQTAEELLASNRDYSIIFRIIRPNGEIRWVRSAASLIQDADGKPVRAVGFVLDITDSWRGELALRHANRRLEEEKTSLARQSLEDPLTGLANRRFLDSELARLCVEANEHREPLSLAMIDVDFFKNYNDRYGHLAGDEALRCIAEAIHSVARRSDIAARYGGEEFVVGFPGTADPEPIIERLAQAIAALDLRHEGSPFGRVTISCGCAVFTPGGSLCCEDLLQACDAALYEAKSLGRNRHVIRSMPAEGT